MSTQEISLAKLNPEPFIQDPIKAIRATAGMDIACKPLSCIEAV